ncbi:MAG: radical SAM protein [Candidatus Hadarchaeales archaeon]
MRELEELREFRREVGPIRPPSEGGSCSLLLRVTRNCPWSLCKFCYGRPYGRGRFSLRTVEEVKGEVERMGRVLELLREKGEEVWRLLPHLPEGSREGLYNLLSWSSSGSRTIFLQDADVLLMPTPKLVEILEEVRRRLGEMERITCYARGRSLSRKSVEELGRLREAGLSRLHVGLESGDGEVLERMNKGLTPQEVVEGGRKAGEAGLELSLYYILGLGGEERWEAHARNTARVLNEVNPEFVRVRRLVPLRGTPLFQEWREGSFRLQSPHGELRELKLLVEELEFSGRLCFDHFANPFYLTPGGPRWVFDQSYSGYRFPAEKDEVLRRIEEGLEREETLYVSSASLSVLEAL